jgi:hypothetical protein
MATRLVPSGSEFQVNVTDTTGSQGNPRAATLTDGRIAVTYETSGGDVTVTAIGSFLNRLTEAGTQTDPVVAPRLGGETGIVFTDNSHADGTADPNGPNITYRVISASGSSPNSTAIADFNGGMGHDALNDPDIATLSTGRQVVVFVRIFSGSDSDILLNVVDAAGTGTQFPATSPLLVAGNTDFQFHPAVGASGNHALVVYADTTGTTTNSTNILARLFDGSSNTLGAQFTIADHAAAVDDARVAALADNRYVIVYSDDVDIWGRIYDASTPGGAFLSDEFRIDAPGGSALRPAVAATLDGGFIVTWTAISISLDVHARRFDAHGLAYGDEFTVNTLKDLQQDASTVAVSGSNVVIAWHDLGARPTDPEPGGIRAQAFTTTVFDYDSAGIGDFDGNGRADILFQNDTGDVAVWQTNGAGALSAITSLGQRPAGYLIDGTGNFNSTPGDDILLRSSGGSLAVWPTSGIAVQGPVVIGSTSATYHNAGIGDFTGDGQDDLLFRNDAGQIVTWAIANNALAQAPQVLGSTAPVYHIVGVDDLTGDGQADILFRHDNGDIALWQVANNQLAGIPKVIGSTSPSYHIVSTGDFDGNGANDILFRGDNGELVEWLLDSTGSLLMAPTSIGTVGAQYHVDGTGDLNGDGRDDIIFRDATGTLVEWLMNGTSLAGPPAVMGLAAVDYAIAAHHFDVV